MNPNPSTIDSTIQAGGSNSKNKTDSVNNNPKPLSEDEKAKIAKEKATALLKE